MKIVEKILGRIFIAIRSRIEHMMTVYNSSVIKNPTGSATVSGKVFLQYPEHISIGSCSYVNGGQLIASPNAYIKIGCNCLLSYNVHIRTDMHLYREAGIPIKEQGYREADIIIETKNNCQEGLHNTKKLLCRQDKNNQVKEIHKMVENLCQLCI